MKLFSAIENVWIYLNLREHITCLNYRNLSEIESDSYKCFLRVQKHNSTVFV